MAKSFFDTRRVYIILKLLDKLPFTGYWQKMFYLRLRMPWASSNFPDQALGGTASIIEEALKGDLNSLSFNEAVEKLENLNMREMGFVLEQLIPINPMLVLQLYKHFEIKNRRYFYLYYAFNPDVKAEPFFSDECVRDSDACLNAYDYFLRNSDIGKAEKSLNSYFIANKLETISKTNEKEPFYVDNLSVEEIMKDCGSTALISIIMTVKDEEQLISYALDSIFQQSYKNIELVLVDDGSKDNTVSIFKDVCKQYGFKKYIVISLERNVGTFVGKNIALRYATGEIITFHDADDWSHPRKLQLQVSSLIEKSHIASVSNMIRLRLDGTILSKPIYPPHSLCMISLMFRREVFEKLGFFRTGLYGADAEYYERMIAYYGQAKIDTLSEILTYAAHRSGSLTTSSMSDYGVSPVRAKNWETCRQLQMENFKIFGSQYVSFELDYDYSIERSI